MSSRFHGTVVGRCHRSKPVVPELEAKRNGTMRIVILSLFAVLAFGCSDSGYVAQPGTDKLVDAVGVTSWNPSPITIKAGDAVTFRNSSAVTHNVRFEQGTAGTPADVPNFESSSKTVTFATVGTYAYHCGIHPAMQGQVIVQP
jgi:plastocyanin